jgi:hypothetical protein
LGHVAAHILADLILLVRRKVFERPAELLHGERFRLGEAGGKD